MKPHGTNPVKTPFTNYQNALRFRCTYIYTKAASKTLKTKSTNKTSFKKQQKLGNPKPGITRLGVAAVLYVAGPDVLGDTNCGAFAKAMETKALLTNELAQP